jgi:hypothetical protein
VRSWADNLTFDVELFANTSASPVGLLSALETLPWLHAAGFLHEATHQWCFTRTATKTIAWAQASYLSNMIHWFLGSFSRRDPVSDAEYREIAARIVELEFFTHLRRLLTPLYEGLALYAELDAGWSKSANPPPLQWLGRLFDVPATGFSLFGRDRNRDCFNFLVTQRTAAQGFLERRKTVFAEPYSFAGDGYAPGYCFVRGLRKRFRELDDSEFLNLVVLYIFDDPIFGLLAIDETKSPQSRLSEIVQHVSRRLAELAAGQSAIRKRVADAPADLWNLPSEMRCALAGRDSKDLDRMFDLLQKCAPTMDDRAVKVFDQNPYLRIATFPVEIMIRPEGTGHLISVQPKDKTASQISPRADGQRLAFLVSEGFYEAGVQDGTGELLVELTGDNFVLAIYDLKHTLIEVFRRNTQSGELKTADDLREHFDDADSRAWLARTRRESPTTYSDFLCGKGVVHVTMRDDGTVGQTRTFDTKRVQELIDQANLPNDAAMDSLCRELYRIDEYGVFTRVEPSDPTDVRIRKSGIRKLFRDVSSFQAFCLWDACSTNRLSQSAARKVFERELNDQMAAREETFLEDLRKWGITATYSAQK